MSSSTNKRTNGTTLGEVVRQARHSMGLSIRQVAPLIGVHQSFLSRLESGEYLSAKPAVLQRISRVLEIDERDLFALAGHELPEGLPAFAPYLRAKYQLSEDALQELQSHFHYIADKYDVKEKRPPAA